MDVVIIGAGLSGLVTGFYAKKRGLSVAILERAPRAGGAFRSERREGFLLEFGPNTVQLKPEILELVQNLELEGTMQVADPRAPRYVLFQGKLHTVPISPPGLFSTSLLTLGGKLRLLSEPFVAKKSDATDENLLSFSRRRFGPQTADRLVAPFVSGIWAGDAEQLSARSAFPMLFEWETEHGSVIKGALFSKKGKKTKKGLLTFRDGLESLTRRLAGFLKAEIVTGEAVEDIERGESGRWFVKTANRTLQSKSVVLTAPAGETARMTSPLSTAAAEMLRSIPYAPIVILHLGFKKSHIGHPRAGFGYLAAPSEKSPVLGCLWNSNLFPDRAPDGATLCTVFMGGASNAATLNAFDGELVKNAVEALRPLMKIKENPFFTSITRIEKAIPQYVMGHIERMRVLDETERQLPGLFFGGNYKDGIAVGDVLKAAKKRAELLP